MYVKKGVSKEEADATAQVYKNDHSNKTKSLLLKRPVKRSNGKFNLHMQKLIPLEHKNLTKYTFTKDAIKMLKKQFALLHTFRAHSDLHTGALYEPKNKNKISGIQRQILARIDDDEVKEMYLSDFDVRGTSDTIDDEKKLLQTFISIITSPSNKSRHRRYNYKEKSTVARSLLF